MGRHKNNGAASKVGAQDEELKEQDLVTEEGDETQDDDLEDEKSDEEEVEVKMLNIATGDYGVYLPFHTYKMPAARAADLMKSGHAERV